MRGIALSILTVGWLLAWTLKPAEDEKTNKLARSISMTLAFLTICSVVAGFRRTK
jgi:hypothetical protein